MHTSRRFFTVLTAALLASGALTGLAQAQGTSGKPANYPGDARVSIVEYFGSDSDESAQFAAGANDLYAHHGAQISYIGKQDWSHRALSFQSNSTVVRRDARGERRIPFSYGAVVKENQLQQNLMLQSGDTVIVP